ncbi:2-oxoglutarate dehydrogenase complex dihydrolipoyllysine-residue succinyltransferase [Candidatus Paracaedibacter symbiosus]|uniref:2-oxoglutarate dehydrogenase complex dihydrolipoyllysine-residue succinyltransferase n=1 Tax=Candidatus Paracaedibacter symbiosus TaxID=244582 RepID=UPI0005099F86|nr:2-oxoglutarate dehydrogenase complex dihydrolipoyllysine-residue succinyltransferase [Candidatus Paracaedibacter symbiosus]
MPENREVKVPPLGESVSEATVARWTKKAGEAVVADEILVELETDKVTLEVTAPANGVLQSIAQQQGATVLVGDILGVVEVGGVATVAPAPVAPKAEAPALQSQPTSLANTDTLSPAVRRLVTENNLKPETIAATGKDNRLTKADVVTHLATATAVQPMEVPTYHSDKQEERVRMTRLRQRIAERLKQAQNTAAILTTFNEVDMTAVNACRARYKEKFEKKYGVRLGFMSFFVKAAIQALKEIPAINAEIDGEDIIYKNYYDIGVAVSAPQGLVVPVVRGADMRSFAELEAKIGELGLKAKDGKLSMNDMTGGTFTVSNGGVFGSLMSTPILNPPQTGILGMHKVQDRPMVVDGKIEIRPMMYIALSYDHRLIDGREAVTFLVRVKENIENPERLLLEI